MKNIKTFYRSNLPHLVPIGATFFVTFRLGDSLPRETIRALKVDMDAKVLQLQKEKPKHYEEEIQRQRKLFFKNYDHQLDTKPYGNCFLRNPAIAQIVANKLHDLNGKMYRLIAYSIMPNHVHLLVDTSIQTVKESEHGVVANNRPTKYYQLHQIMQNIKGNTAYFANKYLGRSGKFWQKDSYDHLVRNDKECDNIVNYILQNPVKAKLVDRWEDYPYVFVVEHLRE